MAGRTLTVEQIILFSRPFDKMCCIVNVELHQHYNNLECLFHFTIKNAWKVIGISLKGVIVKFWAGEFVCGQVEIFSYHPTGFKRKNLISSPSYISNLRPFEVVGGGSETQLQVGTNSNLRT